MSPKLGESGEEAVTWTVREELARIDLDLVGLLADRLALVERLWSHKRVRRLPLEDLRQEDRVLSRSARWAVARRIRPGFVEQLFRMIIAEGKRTAVRPLGLRGSPGARTPAPRSTSPGPVRNAGRGAAARGPARRAYDRALPSRRRPRHGPHRPDRARPVPRGHTRTARPAGRRAS